MLQKTWVLTRFTTGQAGRLVEPELVAFNGLLDDGPDERGDPTEHSPAEQHVNENNFAAVQNVAAHGYECGDQIEEGGIGRPVLFGGPVELRLW